MIGHLETQIKRHSQFSLSVCPPNMVVGARLATHLVLLALLVCTIGPADALKRPKSNVVGKIVSCVDCPLSSEVDAKIFAREHASVYSGLSVEEVSSPDIHLLVVQDRFTSKEIGRHDISELSVAEIQSLVKRSGLKVIPAKTHGAGNTHMRAELQHCATCDSLRDRDAHKFAQFFEQNFGNVSGGRNDVRDSHDCVVFDAAGKELERIDITHLSKSQINDYLVSKGFKLRKALGTARRTAGPRGLQTRQKFNKRTRANARPLHESLVRD